MLNRLVAKFFTCAPYRFTEHIVHSVTVSIKVFESCKTTMTFYVGVCVRDLGLPTVVTERLTLHKKRKIGHCDFCKPISRVKHWPREDETIRCKTGCVFYHVFVSLCVLSASHVMYVF